MVLWRLRLYTKDGWIHSLEHHCDEAQRKARIRRKSGPIHIMFKDTGARGEKEMALYDTRSQTILIKLDPPLVSQQTCVLPPPPFPLVVTLAANQCLWSASFLVNQVNSNCLKWDRSDSFEILWQRTHVRCPRLVSVRAALLESQLYEEPLGYISEPGNK